MVVHLLLLRFSMPDCISSLHSSAIQYLYHVGYSGGRHKIGCPIFQDDFNLTNLVVGTLSVLVQPDEEIQHGPGHLKLHIEGERLRLLQVDVGVWGSVDDGVHVAQGKQPYQLHTLRWTPLAGGTVGQGNRNLKNKEFLFTSLCLNP